MKFNSLIKTLTISGFISLQTFALKAEANPNELLIGVVPNVSARIILANYQPLADHLAQDLGVKMSIVTSTDFSAFHRRTLAGEFDLIVTAPNLGRLAEVDGGWSPLAVMEPQIPALLVGLSSRPNAQISSLKGKKLALANPSSLVAIAGLNWLEAQGLNHRKDYQILRIANDDSLGLALRSGEAAFAIMSLGEFRAKPEALQKELQVIREFIRVPGFFVMSNPRLSVEEKNAITASLESLGKRQQGQKFMEMSGFKGTRSITEDDRKLLDSYLELTRSGLSARPN